MPGQKNRRKDGKTLFYRTLPTTTGGPKMDGTVLEEKSSFNMLGLTYSSKLD